MLIGKYFEDEGVPSVVIEAAYTFTDGHEEEFFTTTTQGVRNGTNGLVEAQDFRRPMVIVLKLPTRLQAVIGDLIRVIGHGGLADNRVCFVRGGRFYESFYVGEFFVRRQVGEALQEVLAGSVDGDGQVKVVHFFWRLFLSKWKNQLTNCTGA